MVWQNSNTCLSGRSRANQTSPDADDTKLWSIAEDVWVGFDDAAACIAGKKEATITVSKAFNAFNREVALSVTVSPSPFMPKALK